VSIAYPRTAAKPRSQADDHLAGLASRFIEQRLDEEPGWYEVLDHLKDAHRKTHEQAGHGALLAILDLEWSGVMAIDAATDRYRRVRPGDPPAAPLEEVAAAVLSLGWPGPDGKRSRTIFRAFHELGGRFRHCDVYWAMHERLKNRELVCHRANWRRLGDDAIVAAKLADPRTPIAERVELEQQREATLVADYIATLDHPVLEQHKLEHSFGLRWADIFDRERRLIIEAKAYADDVVALGAITQAMLYRTIINRDRELVDRVAVLLPGEPSALARQVARTHDFDVDVIWPEGEGFRHEPFE
jgi:hypothetical protein